MSEEELKMWHEYALSLDDKLEHALRKIEDQQLLLTRAADALEAYAPVIEAKLIDELRKAAE